MTPKTDRRPRAMRNILAYLLGLAALSTLSACGESALGETTLGAKVQATATAGTPAPTVIFTASETTVRAGNAAQLQWKTTNATSCQSSGGWSGSRPLAGIATSSDLQKNTLFTLSCTGPGGTTAQSVEVTIKEAGPTLTLTATPSTIAEGGSATLHWSSQNTSSCEAYHGWSGSLPTSGSWSTGALHNTLQFDLTCRGAGGFVTQSTTVTVAAPSPTVRLSANPSTIKPGTTSTLSWSASNATSCAASGGWSGNQALSGSVATAALSKTTSFVLTCTGAGGTASQSTTVSVESAAPSVALSANPTSVAPGAASTITWSSQNATSCVASGGWSGSKSVNGGKVSTPSLFSSTTYSLACTGPAGTASQSVIVSVKSPVPTVSLSVGPSAIQSGQSATLNWSTKNADQCVATGAWSGSKATKGTQSTGDLSKTSTFTLTCSGNGGSATQSATVSVKSPTPTVTLTANPASVTAGQASTLTWASTEATTCTASGGWTGAKSVTGGSVSTAALEHTTTYNLTCTGAGGSASQSVTVTVAAASAPAITLAVNPSTIASGSSSTLSWTAKSATACTASGGWSGSKPTTGTASTGALAKSTTYSLACTGAGGSATQSVTVSVSTAVPTVSFSVSPSTISRGASATLTWSSKNATACTASGGWSGAKAVSGSQSTGALTANTMFTLSCTGPGGTGAQSVNVAVTQPAPTVSLSANPTSIAYQASSTLSWSATNATACTASGGWSGSKSVSGGSVSTPALTANTTYTLTCSGAGGNASQSVTVSVKSPAPTISLSASPSTVTSGAGATLQWSSTNATACTASGGWSGSKAVTGTQSTGNLSATTTFTLACTGAGGSASQSTVVTVNKAAPTVTLSASPSTVTQGGKATLKWSSTNATACTASGGWSGAEPTSGSTSTAALSATTQYTLACTGPGGTASQSATVSVTSTAPTVSLTASPGSVSSGGSSTLSWTSSNATACTASGAWSGGQGTSGSKSTGALTSSETYTITCTGPGGSASDSATVEVSSTSQAAASCTGTSGTLTLRASVTRSSGISPLLVFFDATATTDSAITGNTTAFQDVTYTWNFGDGGASGTDTWAYGANKNNNSRNTAIGGIAAHLYVTSSDTSYVATVTAHNGANTASCQLGVTASNPAGANGFAGTKTTCVSASGTPVAGSGGCPAGAAVLRTSNFNTALGSANFGSNRRVLFKCGDTFTGDNASVSGTHWSIGAYGGCENTTSGRPVLSDSGSNGELLVSTTAGDGRIADIDFEGNGRGAFAVESGGGNAIAYQITMYNLNSNGNNANYAWSQGAQWGVIDSTMTGMRTSIGLYANWSGNNPSQWTGNPYNNVNYQAIIGNLINGNGGTNDGAGQETMRISACRLCVISNNTIENANSVGAVLKIHNGNPGSTSKWSGVYTEYLEIDGNWFGGTSGSQAIENAPQNGGDDERLRNIVFERNIVSTGPNGAGGKLLVSAVNETIRDNVFYTASGISPAPFYPVQVAQRGIEPLPQGVEAYNNSCVRSQYCVGFDGEFYHAAPANSYAKNNLYYNTTNNYATVVDKGSGNQIGPNTGAPSANPSFTNGSGTSSMISDFKPTANFTGGTVVPVWYDALGVPWSAGWNLGAIHN